MIYGHNIYLFYPSIEPVLKIVQNAMEKAFEINIPSYESWIIQRLDICYAWRLSTQEEAYLAFLVLNPFDYSRKNKIAFDTSFEMKGSSFDFKGYLKFDEFKNHDFKRFKKLKRLGLAYDFLELSKGVFRIELSMRKKKLQTYFKKELTYTDINNTVPLQKILREHFSQYLNHIDTKVMEEKEIIAKLFSIFKPSKALNLFSFYNLWHHPNPSIRARNRNAYKKQLHPSTLWRKHNELRKAKVGISNQKNKFNFDFSIPSPFVVNTDNAPTASAVEHI